MLELYQAMFSLKLQKLGPSILLLELLSGTLTVSSKASATIFNATNLTTASASTITAKEAKFPKSLQRLLETLQLLQIQ